MKFKQSPPWADFILFESFHKITLEFEITKQRKHDLLYALESNKPVTVQIFRREHKDNQWYIHYRGMVEDLVKDSFNSLLPSILSSNVLIQVGFQNYNIFTACIDKILNSSTDINIYNLKK